MIDGRTGAARRLATIAVGTLPSGVAVNPTSGFVYVANSGADVSVLGVPFLAETVDRLAHHRGASPAAWPSTRVTNRVYVANEAPPAPSR